MKLHLQRLERYVWQLHKNHHCQILQAFSGEAGKSRLISVKRESFSCSHFRRYFQSRGLIAIRVIELAP
jgi:hypothetical protein